MPAIIRVTHNKERPYVMLTRELVDDREIGLQVLGLMSVLLSKPDEWKVMPALLAKELNISRASLYRLLELAIKAGYIYRSVIRSHDAKGRWSTLVHYVVFEDKTAAKAFSNSRTTKKDFHLITTPISNCSLSTESQESAHGVPEQPSLTGATR